jgi:hypothetical protein
MSSSSWFAGLNACLAWWWCCSAGLGVGWAQTPTARDEAFFEMYRRAEPITKWPIKKLVRAVPELKGLQPDDSQANLPALLSGVARNLELFRKNFADTASMETIEESRVRDTTTSVDAGLMLPLLGALRAVPSDKAREQFRYVMLTDPKSGGFLEYRTDLRGHPENKRPASGFVKTSGFVTLPFFFAAGAQALSIFRHLGSQTLGDRACQVVAFAEHAEALAVRGRWESGPNSIPLIMQGVAWIDPAIDQIVRLRTDLRAPQPEAGLRWLTTLVVFEPVKFQSRPVVFWLPQEVTVTVGALDYTYENRHHYSEYQLFNVETQQTVQEPKQDIPQQP